MSKVCVFLWIGLEAVLMGKDDPIAGNCQNCSKISGNCYREKKCCRYFTIYFNKANYISFGWSFPVRNLPCLVLGSWPKLSSKFLQCLLPLPEYWGGWYQYDYEKHLLWSLKSSFSPRSPIKSISFVWEKDAVMILDGLPGYLKSCFAL